MTPTTQKGDLQRSAAQTHRRLRLLVAFGSLLLLLLLLRIGWMQTIHTAHFTALSTENHLRQIPLPPSRGLIFDRHGILLADNSVEYSLSLVPSQVDDLDATISKLRELADIHDREVQRFQQRGQSSKFETTPLKIDLSEETIARIAVQLHQLPSVYLEAYAARRYTYGESTAHVLGHLASISKKDRERIDLYRYRGTRRIGRAGIEHQYESLLLGTPGLQQAEVNAQGRSLMVHDRKAPTPGSNLVLTLDADLQRVASDAMAGLEGAIVAIEPSTGDILALVSTPSFDPGVFGHSIDPDDYQNLIRDAKNPLLNRAIQGQYAPGSTIKPFVALAGLESGHAIPDKQFFAAPQFKIPNYRRPFRDWKDEGHGWVTVSSSITQSCDVYFYSLAYRMGVEALEPFLAQFGLGQTQQLDLPGERAGLLPNETWKQKMYGQPWYPGETVIMGIGQGYLLLTPLQLATATAALATRGIRMKPRLLRAYEQDGEIVENPTEELGRVTLSNPAWWDLVTNAMVDVVHAENGTARRSGLDAAYRIAGKTGTAQVINYGEKRPDSEDLPEHIRDHSLFIAFAPAEAPEIALAVIVEHGGHGSTMAAPIARQVLDAYLLRAL